MAFYTVWFPPPDLYKYWQSVTWSYVLFIDVYRVELTDCIYMRHIFATCLHLIDSPTSDRIDLLYNDTCRWLINSPLFTITDWSVRWLVMYDLVPANKLTSSHTSKPDVPHHSLLRFLHSFYRKQAIFIKKTILIRISTLIWCIFAPLKMTVYSSKFSDLFKG